MVGHEEAQRATALFGLWETLTAGFRSRPGDPKDEPSSRLWPDSLASYKASAAASKLRHRKERANMDTVWAQKLKSACESTALQELLSDIDKLDRSRRDPQLIVHENVRRAIDSLVEARNEYFKQAGLTLPPRR